MTYELDYSTQGGTHTFSFEFGDVLGPDSSCARFCVSLSLAWNNLKFMHDQYLEALQGDESKSFERVFWARSIAAEVWELREFLRDSRTDDCVDRFLRYLRADGKQDLREIEQLRGEFKPLIAGSRNHFNHVPSITSGGLKKAMRAEADTPVSFTAGGTFGEVQLQYANEVFGRFFVGALAEDPAQLAEYFAYLRDLGLAALRFTQYAVGLYFRQETDLAQLIRRG